MGADETTLTLLGFALVASMIILTFGVSKDYRIFPMILSGCYITIGQQVVIGPLHFSAFRIILLAGWLRLLFRREISLRSFNAVDKMLITWVLVNSFINIFLQYGGSWAAFINRLGFAYDVIGLYFLFRIYINDISDVWRTIRLVAISILPLAVLMIVERVTGNNPFAMFGGTFQLIRDGIPRASGSFVSPIGTGTFGATLLPLFVSLWWQEGISKVFAAMGLIGAIVIVLMANSGGPLATLAFGIMGMAAWKLRSHLKALMWGAILCLLYINFWMKAPIWYLLARTSSVTGGGGYHRAVLIEKAIEHFDEWWLCGTNYTAHWGGGLTTLEINPRMVDMTNQYLVVGMQGGVLSMILFMVVIALCFHCSYKWFLIIPEEYVETRILVWSMGVVLFQHVVSFMSVSYFDQMVVFWYLLLATIVSVSDYLYNIEDIESLTQKQCYADDNGNA
jgi:hypothetical protein